MHPTTVICLLRSVNVGGHGILKMEALRALCTSLKFRNVQTYVQSGNVVFHSDEADLDVLVQKIEKALERKFGFRPAVMLRTTADLRRIVAKNPFAKRSDIEPSRLLVSFLGTDPPKDALQIIREKNPGREEVHLHGRELYIYFPDGIARSKLSTALLDRALKTPGTARSWNTVNKLLAIAESLESAA